MTPSCQVDSVQRVATKQYFLALATTFLGVGRSQKSMVHDGSRLYGQSLKMLNTILADSSRYGVIEAISSVIALCFHEVSRCISSLAF